GGAAEAGLRGTEIGVSDLVQLGDIITAIDDEPVSSMNELLGELEKHSAGESVLVEFLRDGDPMQASVRLR
ncbi:MAG: PDZ domain-containing protein, partial [Planctomycetota bacterium]